MEENRVMEMDQAVAETGMFDDIGVVDMPAEEACNSGSGLFGKVACVAVGAVIGVAATIGTKMLIKRKSRKEEKQDGSDVCSDFDDGDGSKWDLPEEKPAIEVEEATEK